MSDPKLSRLDQLCRLRAESSTELAVEAHRELHLIIATESGNQRLAVTLSKLYDDVERLIHAGMSRIDPEEMAGWRDTGRWWRRLRRAMATPRHG